MSSSATPQEQRRQPGTARTVAWYLRRCDACLSRWARLHPARPPCPAGWPPCALRLARTQARRLLLAESALRTGLAAPAEVRPPAVGSRRLEKSPDTSSADCCSTQDRVSSRWVGHPAGGRGVAPEQASQRQSVHTSPSAAVDPHDAWVVHCAYGTAEDARSDDSIRLHARGSGCPGGAFTQGELWACAHGDHCTEQESLLRNAEPETRTVSTCNLQARRWPDASVADR